METFADVFDLLAGPPAVAGLILTAAVIFLSSHWRLSLAALLVQYLLVALTLTRLVQPELAIVRGLVGMLVVPILYMTARRTDERRMPEEEGRRAEFLGISLGWSTSGLGLALRVLALLLFALALIRFFPDYLSLLPSAAASSLQLPGDIAFASLWLAGVGTAGLLLSGDALRVAPAALTILAGFDLVYAGLEPNLAVVGFFGALTLLAALAFSYLAGIQILSGSLAGTDEQADDL